MKPTEIYIHFKKDNGMNFPPIPDETIAATLYNVLLRFQATMTPYEERVFVEAIREFDPELHAAITDEADEPYEDDEYDGEQETEDGEPSKDEFDI